MRYAAIALFFFMPLSRAGISFFTGVLTLLWIVEGGFKEKWEMVKGERFFQLLLLFLLYLLLSFFWSDNLYTAQKEMRNYLYYFPLIWIFYSSFKQEDVSVFVRAFLLGMFISEVISYGLYFEWWHKEGILPNSFSPFMHHIVYSIFLAVTALLTFNKLLFEEEKWWMKGFFLLLFLMGVGSLSINLGRTGQVAFFVTLIFLILSHFKFNLKTLLLSIFFLASLFSLVYLLVPQVQHRVWQAQDDFTQMQEKQNYDTSIGGRIAMQIVGLEIIKKHPFIGVGIGDEKEAIVEAVSQPELEKFSFITRYSHLHNQYLQFLVQGGIIGLILFFALFWLLSERVKGSLVASSYLLILSGVYMVGFFGEVLLRRQFSMLLFVLLIALVLLAAKPSSYQD
jgi:O-antigen ligase